MSAILCSRLESFSATRRLYSWTSSVEGLCCPLLPCLLSLSFDLGLQRLKKTLNFSVIYKKLHCTLANQEWPRPTMMDLDQTWPTMVSTTTHYGQPWANQGQHWLTISHGQPWPPKTNQGQPWQTRANHDHHDHHDQSWPSIFISQIRPRPAKGNHGQQWLIIVYHSYWQSRYPRITGFEPEIENWTSWRHLL